MGEAIGKSGPCIDVAQDLRDPCPWQHSVKPNGKIARRIRNGWLGASNIEVAVLDLDAVEALS